MSELMLLLDDKCENIVDKRLPPPPSIDRSIEVYYYFVAAEF